MLTLKEGRHKNTDPDPQLGGSVQPDALVQTVQRLHEVPGDQARVTGPGQTTLSPRQRCLPFRGRTRRGTLRSDTDSGRLRRGVIRDGTPRPPGRWEGQIRLATISAA